MHTGSNRRRRVYLRTLRRKRGLTQDQLAALCGLPQNTISRLETKENVRPSWDSVDAIAGALKVDPTSLLFGPDPDDRPRRRPAVKARAHGHGAAAGV
jgi:transcriptional regulator with XRE-family HTH domain